MEGSTAGRELTLVPANACVALDPSGLPNRWATLTGFCLFVYVFVLAQSNEPGLTQASGGGAPWPTTRAPAWPGAVKADWQPVGTAALLGRLWGEKTEEGTGLQASCWDQGPGADPAPQTEAASHALPWSAGYKEEP